MPKLSRLWIPVGLLAPALLVAQERRPIRDNQTDRPAAQTERPGVTDRTRTPKVNLDQHIIACLINDNEGEIELSKYAQERAQSKEVKDFAEQMITDHGQMVRKLKQLQGDSEPKRDIQLQIKKEIAERCLASIQRELDQKKGADFDRCFMGVQQMGHMKMVDQLAVLEKYASPQLQRTLAQGSETAKTHLTHAKTLLAKLEGAAASETARRPGSENK